MKKKLTRTQLEAKLRAMQLEDMVEDMLPLDEMKKRAMYEYAIRQRMEQRKHKSGISHRLIIVMSIAICLIGGSFLFSVFAPTVVSNANDFMRRTGIWFNDVLQLGIVVETPLNSPDDGFDDSTKMQTSFVSVEKASKYFGVPLLKLKDGVEGYSLTPPEANIGTDPFYRLKYTYSLGEQNLDVIFERILDETSINIRNDADKMETVLGELSVWEQNGVVGLVFAHDGFIVRISSTFTRDETDALIGDLSWTTQ